MAYQGRNRGMMEDVFSIVKQAPGLTQIQIKEVLNKMKTEDGKPKYRNTSSSVSSLLSQLNKKKRVYYQAGGKGVHDRPCFKVYAGNEPTLFGPNRGRRIQRHKVNGAAPAAQPVVTKAVYNGEKVDVQLLIAIGDKDTMVGFATARALYNQLKLIFEAE